MKNSIDHSEYCKRTIHREEDIRGPYFRDQTAIIHSMPFRRLKHKTQVFFSPENDHVCTRIEHVLHVATIASTICKGLSEKGWDLNSELAYAIGLGHDLGHAPFGHAGETALSNITGKKFYHEIHSYRIAEKISNYGRGLNLTYAVKDGIVCHNGEKFERELIPDDKIKDLDKIDDRNNIPSSYEGCIVRFSDKIAYLGRDIEDAITAKLIYIEDVPKYIRKELGNNNGKIINTLIIDLVENSHKNNKICFSDAKHKMVKDLKEYNYKNIYNHEIINTYKERTEKIIKELYDYLKKLYSKNLQDYKKYNKSEVDLDKAFGNYLSKMNEYYNRENFNIDDILTDYIAGMTDNYALKCMEEISLPKPIKFF